MSMNNAAYSRPYVFNPHPQFDRPKEFGARPAFTRKAWNYANTRKVWLWEGFTFLKHQAGRCRRFKEDRAFAIQEITKAIIYYADFVSGQVHRSCTQIADDCRLSTTSDAGNYSITRTTRAIKDMEAYGLLKCELVWDRLLGENIPKLIWVTDLFWAMTGMTQEELKAAQRQKIGNKKKGAIFKVGDDLKAHIAEAKLEGRITFIEKAFEFRKKRHSKKRQVKQAQELINKPLDEQRHEIANSLSLQLSYEEMKKLGTEGLKKVVDVRLGQLRRLSEAIP